MNLQELQNDFLANRSALALLAGLGWDAYDADHFKERYYRKLLANHPGQDRTNALERTIASAEAYLQARESQKTK